MRRGSRRSEVTAPRTGRSRPAAVALVGLVTALAAAPTARAEPKPEAEAPPRVEPVAVIDLRPDNPDRAATRDELVATLAGVNGVAPLTDPELTQALAGVDPARQAADHELERAQTAYGAIDCATTVTAATAAIDDYAALQAAGESVDDAIRRGYVYLLLCANNRGDVDAAQRAATRLRRLFGDTAPTGVNPAVWNRYPAIDAASNISMVELSIATKPPGGEVWLDHVRLGTAPQTALVPAGEHLVAAAGATGAVSRRVDAEPGHAVTLQLPAAGSAPWARVRREIIRWRNGEAVPDAMALADLLNRVGVRFAVVIAGKTQAEVWAYPGEGSPARRVATKTMAAGFELGAAVVEQVELWEGPQDMVALGEPRVEHAASGHRQRWWVYAGIVGAVVIGAGMILAIDLAPDHQRIELTWP